MEKLGQDEEMTDCEIITEELVLEVKNVQDLQDWDPATATVIAEGPPHDL